VLHPFGGKVGRARLRDALGRKLSAKQAIAGKGAPAQMDKFGGRKEGKSQSEESLIKYINTITITTNTLDTSTQETYPYAFIAEGKPASK
jgi:hypothetical protein